MINDGLRPPIPETCPHEFATLMRGIPMCAPRPPLTVIDCWDDDPERRPTFDTVCARLEEMIAACKRPHKEVAP